LLFSLYLPSSLCYSSFFYRLRRPPIFTLFPYTTLFRSRPESDHVLAGGFRPSGLALLPAVPRAGGRGGRPATRTGPGQTRRAAEDRKSTRLNSSHVSISYAVFCLKKKINKSIILQVDVE